MRKLVGSTFVTLDGVISDPQAWGPPYWDEEHFAYAARLLEPADAMLLGRRTYEGFAEAWPQRGGDPFTDKFNAMPKHVASRTLTDTTWNAAVIPGDLVDGVRALKAQDGGTIVKYGTGEVDAALKGKPVQLDEVALDHQRHAQDRPQGSLDTERDVAAGEDEAAGIAVMAGC